MTEEGGWILNDERWAVTCLRTKSVHSVAYLYNISEQWRAALCIHFAAGMEESGAGAQGGTEVRAVEHSTWTPNMGRWAENPNHEKLNGNNAQTKKN